MPWTDNLTEACCSACGKTEVFKSHQAALESGWVQNVRRFADGGEEEYLFCPDHSKAFNVFVDRQDQEFEAFMRGLRK